MASFAWTLDRTPSLMLKWRFKYVWVIMQFRVQFGINLQDWIFQKAGIARVASNKKTLKGKLIPNWTRKKKQYDYLLKNSRGGSTRRSSFLKPCFAFEKTFFKVSVQNCCHLFTWYNWLRKFSIVFQQTIIQNYDVWFALTLCHTFCTGVTLELHCSQPIGIE